MQAAGDHPRRIRFLASGFRRPRWLQRSSPPHESRRRRQASERDASGRWRGRLFPRSDVATPPLSIHLRESGWKAPLNLMGRGRWRTRRGPRSPREDHQQLWEKLPAKKLPPQGRASCPQSVPARPRPARRILFRTICLPPQKMQEDVVHRPPRGRTHLSRNARKPDRVRVRRAALAPRPRCAGRCVSTPRPLPPRGREHH